MTHLPDTQSYEIRNGDLFQVVYADAYMDYTRTLDVVNGDYLLITDSRHSKSLVKFWLNGATGYMYKRDIWSIAKRLDP